MPGPEVSFHVIEKVLRFAATPHDEDQMRAILSALLIALLTTAAFAQGKSAPRGDDGKSAKAAADTQKQRAAEAAAAKEAMSKIPDSKEKYDPWKIAR